MMHALHASSWDSPRPYFGFEVALRFLSPSHQCAGARPRDFFRYLRQPHKQSLLEWSEYKWEGDPTIIDAEAYQAMVNAKVREATVIHLNPQGDTPPEVAQRAMWWSVIAEPPLGTPYHAASMRASTSPRKLYTVMTPSLWPLTTRRGSSEECAYEAARPLAAFALDLLVLA